MGVGFKRLPRPAETVEAAEKFLGAAGETVISSRVFHSPQPIHLPDHLGCSIPQDVHTNKVLTFGGIKASRPLVKVF
jgi:hypothetical protein